MPVSSDILKLSLSLAINNTPTGFWGKLIQSMNENQGAITGAVGFLTLFVLGFQFGVMRRQANISERANEISREVAFLPTQEKILWEWLAELDNLKKRLYSIYSLEFTPQNTIELLTNMRRNNAIFSLKSERAASFFPPEVAAEIKKYSSNPKDFNNLTSAIEKRERYMNSIRHRTTKYSTETGEEFDNLVNVKPGKMANTIYELNEIVIKSIEESEISVISKLRKHDF